MILPPLNYTCLANNKIVKREEQQRLMKFLHGLGSAYDQAKNQILLLGPLPSVDKAYAIIIQVEGELSLGGNTHEGQPMMIMNVGDGSDDQSVQQQVFAAGTRHGLYRRRLTKEEKKKLRCKHCLESGHEVDECFKLHGIPDWYKIYRERYQTNYVDCGEETDSAFEAPDQKLPAHDISKLVQSEVARYLGALNAQGGTSPGKREANLIIKEKGKCKEKT